MFICGSGSFGHEDENEGYTSPCSTPKKSKKNTNFCGIGKDSSNKNPYADRGLDKFYALLAELDDKKQKIYTQVGSDEISFVRFVYPNDSTQVKPIVVKARERNQEKINTQGLVKNQKGNNPVTNPAVVQLQVPDKIGSAEIPDKEAKRSSKTSFGLEKLRHPYYYFPLILMLILLFLVVYGRSFAILCTSIGWYLLPTVNGGRNSSASSSSTSTLKREKESERKFSEKKIANNQGSSSPRSVLNGLNPDKSPLHQEIGRRRSF